MDTCVVTVRGIDNSLWKDFRMTCFLEGKTVVKVLTEMLYVKTSDVRDIRKAKEGLEDPFAGGEENEEYEEDEEGYDEEEEENQRE